MNHKIITSGKEFIITGQDVVDYVLSLEAGGFDYWGELCSADTDYDAALSRMKSKSPSDMKPCYEDVLMDILEHGGVLTVYDREGDEEYKLTLEKLLTGWEKYIEEYGVFDFDNYDGGSADCIMQLALFGEIIFG